MKNLKEIINNDLLTALKSKNEVQLRTLRLLKSSIEKKSKDAGQAVDDSAALAILRQEIKKRKDAMANYEQAGRNDLRKIEEDELEVLQTYLPPELSQEELEIKVKEIIATNNYQPSDFGQIMKKATAEIGPGADGGRISQAVKKLLAT